MKVLRKKTLPLPLSVGTIMPGQNSFGKMTLQTGMSLYLVIFFSQII